MTSNSAFQPNECYQQKQAWELSKLATSFGMMSTRELFYGENEQTFVVKHKINGVHPRPELVLSSMPFYPDFAENSGKEGVEEEDPDIILWVPMCCTQCEDRIIVPVSEMEGVKSVKCNWYKKKVVVSGKALNAHPILLKCRSIFRKAALWKDE